MAIEVCMILFSTPECAITMACTSYSHQRPGIFQGVNHCMKSEFLCSLWQRKESFMPFMANCKWGFYVFYRKVAILNVSKDRFDHSFVYLGEMKLTPFVFLRRLKYTCSSERFLEI